MRKWVFAFGMMQFALFAAGSVLYELALNGNAPPVLRGAASAGTGYLMFVFPNSFYSIAYGLTGSLPISLCLIGAANACFYFAAARSPHLAHVSALRLLAYLLVLSTLTYVGALYAFFHFFFLQPR